METIVRKHTARILKYMVVQQLDGGGFSLQYVVSFYTICVIATVLKTDA